MDNQKKNINDYAIVIGDWHFNSLGIVRSLGEKGITTYFINMSNGGYAESSKYVKDYLRIDGEDKANLKENLLKAVRNITSRENGRALLFPSSDTAALAIDGLKDILGNKCICPNLDGKATELMNKEKMCMVARKAGFNVPDGQCIQVDDDFPSNLKTRKLPFIVKPLASVEGIKSDICICKTEDDIKKAIETFSVSNHCYKRVLVQDFVDGKSNKAITYGGYKIPGKKVQVYGQLEKLREYPYQKGSTSFAVMKENITYLNIDILDRFLEYCHFDGLFDLDIKVVDEIPYFIEINFRNGANSYALTVGGFNVPYGWFCEKTDIKNQPVSFKETVFMSERDDLNHVIDKNISFLSWLKDVHNTDALMVYNKHDSQPFIEAYGKFVTKILSMVTRNLK